MSHEEGTLSFGYWLRRRRQALDLTQSGLASRVGCAPVTISKIERDERRPSREMAELLADHLSIDDDEERARFLAAARGLRSAERMPLPTEPLEKGDQSRISEPATMLPALMTDSIRRELEESQLATLLQEEGVQLVSLVGPGGVGKTHLALQIAHICRDNFRGGVSFLSVESAVSEERVLSLLASHLGVVESRGTSLEEAVLIALGRRRRLLILDNFEQALDAANLIARLLSAAPTLRILITSREPLRLRQERIFFLDPLTLPEESETNWEVLAISRAVRLFALRARVMQPDFTLDEESTMLVAAICRRVDGLPLAIELAAAQLFLFSLPSLLQELTEGTDPTLDLLQTDMRDMPARQRSMRRAIAWSVTLLSDGERALFQKLSVFSGNFGLDAAVAIGAAGTQNGSNLSRSTLLSLLNSLARKNLLQVVGESHSERRFRMLVPVQEYARELLTTSDDASEIFTAHARWFADLVRETHDHFGGPEYLEWLDRIERDVDNLSGAIDWLVDQRQSEIVYAMGARLCWFWRRSGRLAEGLWWIERIRSLDQESVSLAERAHLLLSEAILRLVQGEHTRAPELLWEAISLADQAEVNHVRVLARTHLGWVLSAQRRLPEAIKVLDEGVALAREEGSRWELGMALTISGGCRLALKELALARQAAREGVNQLQMTGEPLGLSYALANLSRILAPTDELFEAENAAQESLEQSRRGQSALDIAVSLTCLARLALVARRHRDAERWGREALRLRLSLGDRHGMATSLAAAGLLAFRRREYRRALFLWEITEREVARMDGRLVTLLSNLYSEQELQSMKSRARASLSDEALNELATQVERQSLGEVVANLLEERANDDGNGESEVRGEG